MQTRQSKHYSTSDTPFCRALILFSVLSMLKSAKRAYAAFFSAFAVIDNPLAFDATEWLVDWL